MLKLEEALFLTLSGARQFGTEVVSLADVNGRVLADPVYSDINMPPFDKSAMDGYACRKDDLGSALDVIEVIQAGFEPQKEIFPGKCAQIMTGAMVPDGADTVIMVEDTEITSEGRIRFKGMQKGDNICYLSEDIRVGDMVIDSGSLIRTQHIPLLATIGASRIKVNRRPIVGVIATGTELVEPDQVPLPSQIRNSNASQMIEQAKEIGLTPKYYGIASDDEQQTFDILERALSSCDILLLSGGVSMGEFDFVPGVLGRLGLKILYQKIAVKPGKPTTFAIGGGKAVFALPGNPVSSFIQFELLVKPYIYKCMGHNWVPRVLKLSAATRMTRKKTSRMSWFPVCLNEEGMVDALDYHGSAHIFALNNAQGFAYFNIGQAVIEKGDIINVRPI